MKQTIVALLVAVVTLVNKWLDSLDPDKRIKSEQIRDSRYADKALLRANAIIKTYQILKETIFPSKNKFINKLIRRIDAHIDVYRDLLAKE